MDRGAWGSQSLTPLKRLTLCKLTGAPLLLHPTPPAPGPRGYVPALRARQGEGRGGAATEGLEAPEPGPGASDDLL